MHHKRNLEFPDYHPKDLRNYFLTDDEQYALCRMDNLADIPFPMEDFPGFSAAPTKVKDYYIMKDEWIEYIMMRVKDRDDPGPNNVKCIYICVLLVLFIVFLLLSLFFVSAFFSFVVSRQNLKCESHM